MAVSQSRLAALACSENASARSFSNGGTVECSPAAEGGSGGVNTRNLRAAKSKWDRSAYRPVDLRGRSIGEGSVRFNADMGVPSTPSIPAQLARMARGRCT
jgi:hypothetical protein